MRPEYCWACLTTSTSCAKLLNMASALVIVNATTSPGAVSCLCLFACFTFVFLAVERMVNVTLSLIVATEKFDRSLLGMEAPGFKPDTPLESLLLSHKDFQLLRKLLTGFCQETHTRTAKVIEVAQLGTVEPSVALTGAELAKIEVTYNGPTKVHSNKYHDANESSIDGCMQVLDRCVIFWSKTSTAI